MSGRLAVVLGEVDPESMCGATRSLLKVVPELERRGWRFDFWTEVPGATERWLDSRGYAVAGSRRLVKFSLRQLRTDPGPWRRVASLPPYLREFDRFLRSTAPDAVLGNTVGTLPELTLARRRRLPTILHVLEILPEGRKYRLARRAMGAVADAIMAPSQATAGQFGAGDRVAVVHTGIARPPAESLALAAARRARRDGVVVGALGTISMRKGTDLLVAAAERLRARRLPISWRLCGRCIEGAERPAAEAILRRAAAAGFTHREHVDPFEELSEWDVLVLASRQDPFPNVVLEAMALGVPVVATRTGGVPEQLGEGAGVLVEPEDPEALAAAIAGLAGDPARRAEIAGRARDRVERLFSVPAQADGTEAVVRGAIERRRSEPRRLR